MPTLEELLKIIFPPNPIIIDWKKLEMDEGHQEEKTPPPKQEKNE